MKKNNNRVQRGIFPLAILLATLLITGAARAVGVAGDFLAQDPNATNQLIIGLRPHTLVTNSVHQRLRQLAGTQLTYQRAAANNAHIYRLPAHMPLSYLRQVAAKIAADPNVLYAEPDIRIRLLRPQSHPRTVVASDLLHVNAGIPNDPLYPRQWDLAATAGGINAPAAWKVTTGSSRIVTAVLDSGVRFEHEDLKGRLIAGINLAEHNMVPVDPGADEQGDIFYHGTNIAGVIGATANNGRGIAGINWVSKILAVRLPMDGNMSDSVDAIHWAAGLPVPGWPANRTPARVLNISWGAAGMGCPQAFRNAIQAVRAKGVVVVVATGNDSLNAATDFPTSCPGVISVAAVNRSGNRSTFSDYGSNITLAAPGEQVVLAGDSKFNPASNSYVVEDGTSFAAPHVVGVVSLMLSVNPGLTPDGVLQLLKQSARPFARGAQCNGICAAGLLDAGRAVALAAGKAASPASTLRAVAGSNQVVQRGTRVTLQGAGQAAAPAHITAFLWQQVSGPMVLLSNPRIARPTFIAPRSTASLVFHLTVTDSSGHRAGAATTITVR